MAGWLFLVVPVWKSVGDWLTGNAFSVLSRVCGWLEQELDGQGTPIGAEWAIFHG